MKAPITVLTLAGLVLAVSSIAPAADRGPSHHAQGSYDAAAASYRVAEGDDLIMIGRRFGVTVADLKQANRLATDKILAGQKLAGATPAPAAGHLLFGLGRHGPG